MPASSKMAGAIALGAGALYAGQVFVQSSTGSVEVSTAVLRGAQAPTQSSTQSSGMATYGLATGVTTLGFLGLAKGKAIKRSSGVVRKYGENELGAQAPLGFWDPLGFSTDAAKFRDFREKEIKHGRLAMMGALGMLTQSLVQLPGMEGVPKDVTACTVGNGQTGFLLVLATIAALEAAVFQQDPNKEPGNFGNPVPWFDDYSDEMRSKELNNGRIAMFSAIGIIASSLYTGKAAIEQLG